MIKQNHHTSDGIGGVIHCHFLQHNDANSMIIQYFVEQ